MKGSIEEKLQRVAELDEVDMEDHVNLPIGLLRHAVLNTIPLFELVRFFIAEGSHNKSISSNLRKRLREEKDCRKIY